LNKGHELSRTIQRAFAEFALLSRLDLAAEKVCEDLDAVADAEDRNAELENVLVGQRRIFGINAGRAAGKDEAARFQRGESASAGVP